MADRMRQPALFVQEQQEILHQLGGLAAEHGSQEALALVGGDGRVGKDLGEFRGAVDDLPQVAQFLSDGLAVVALRPPDRAMPGRYATAVGD